MIHFIKRNREAKRRGEMRTRTSESWCGKVFSLSPVLLVTLSLLVLAGCQQKMAKQPSFRPLEGDSFFDDGRASRPWVEGTVYVGKRPPFSPIMTGLTPEGQKFEPRVNEAAIPAGAPDDVKNYVDAFPFKMTEADLIRGQERFTIYCTPCHSPLGDGKGKIVERGFLKPTSFHPDRKFAEKQKADGILPTSPEYKLPIGYSRGFNRYRLEVPMDEVPVGYIFEVITRGYGGMPSHAEPQITPEDRWRIIAYVRALQLSQSMNLKDLPPKEQEAARKALDEAAKDKAGSKHP